MDRPEKLKMKWKDIPKNEIKSRCIKIPDSIYNVYSERKENGEAGSISVQIYNDLVNNGGFND